MYYGTGKLKCFNKWALLECDDGIGQMYRSLYSLEYFYKPKIQKPLWGSHISIVRGEIMDEKMKSALPTWITYGYLQEMKTNGIYFWIPVVCPILDTIREMFGLPKSKVNYHLSIGNIVKGNGYAIPQVY